MLMPAFAMRQRGQDLPLDGRKKSPGPRFTATLGTLYRDNRDCRPSRETNVCAVHTLWHGCGPKEWQFRTRGALCAQTSRSPPCLRRREQPQSGHMAKNRSVLHMLCKYDTMARAHTHATHTSKGLSEYDCSSRQGPPRPQMYVPQMSQLGPPVHGV